MNIRWLEPTRFIATEAYGDLLIEKCKLVPLGASEQEREKYIAQAKKEIAADIEFEKKLRLEREDDYPTLSYQRLGSI